jgi:hypothetical protein
MKHNKYHGTLQRKKKLKRKRKKFEKDKKNEC